MIDLLSACKYKRSAVSEQFTIRPPQSLLEVKILNFNYSTRITLVRCWRVVVSVFISVLNENGSINRKKEKLPGSRSQNKYLVLMQSSVLAARTERWSAFCFSRQMLR